MMAMAQSRAHPTQAGGRDPSQQRTQSPYLPGTPTPHAHAHRSEDAKRQGIQWNSGHPSECFGVTPHNNTITPTVTTTTTTKRVP